MEPGDPLLDLAASDPVATPNVIPAGRETVIYAAVGAGLGGAIAGPPGAFVGGALGWAADTLRRRLMRTKREISHE